MIPSAPPHLYLWYKLGKAGPGQGWHQEVPVPAPAKAGQLPRFPVAILGEKRSRCQPGPPLTLPTVCNRKEVRCRKEHISSLMYETVAARLVSQKAPLWSSCGEERVTSGPQQGTRAYFHLWG